MLAVDPTSPFSGGAILGDRVRMQDHATDPGVFIRSMATRGHLGGLALATPQAVRVLDAVGKPWILVETVGVGQVEVEIAGAADTTVVVVNPGWGDGVQANKAGLLEIADVFVVNKADRAGADDDGPRPRARCSSSAAHATWTPPIVRDGRDRRRGRRRAVGRDRARTASYLERHRRARAPPRATVLRDELRAIVVARLGRSVDDACRGDGVRRARRAGRGPRARPVRRGRGCSTTDAGAAFGDAERQAPTDPRRSAAMTDALVLTERRADGVARRAAQPSADEPAVAGAARRARRRRRPRSRPTRGEGGRGHRQREGVRGRRRHRRVRRPGRRARDRRAASAPRSTRSRAIPRPVIAAITGSRSAAGSSSRSRCDLRIAGDTARLGQPEILLGIIPGAGGTQRLAAARRPGPGQGADLERPSGAGRRGARDRARRPRRCPPTRLEAEALDVGRRARVRARSSRWGCAKRRDRRGARRLARRAALDVEAEAFVEVVRHRGRPQRRRSFLEHGPGKRPSAVADPAPGPASRLHRGAEPPAQCVGVLGLGSEALEVAPPDPA